MHNDDTTMRVQSLGKEIAAAAETLPINARASSPPASSPKWTTIRSLCSSLLRLQPDGTLDSGNQFALSAESRLLLSEFYSSGSGQVRTFTQEPPEVTALALKPDGRIVIGGNFAGYGGVPAYGLAEMYPDGTPTGLLRLDSAKVVQNGRVSLTLIVPVNEAVTLERSVDLSRWEAVLTITSATNRTEVFDPDWLRVDRRFYRLRSGER